MQAVLKHSKQRDAIKAMLQSRYDHPTAEQLYTDLKPDFPKISLGTVYRNLALLDKIGEIKKIATVGGIDRFDGNTKQHYHFTCTSCGCVADVDIAPNKDLDVQVEKLTDADISAHSLIFYGVCKNCKKIKKSIDK